jgi:hypothetical protein
MFLSEWRQFPSAPCLAEKKKLDDSSRLDVVEIARVPDMLPSLFPSCSGYLSASEFVSFLFGLLISSRVCFLPVRATNLLAPRYIVNIANVSKVK